MKLAVILLVTLFGMHYAPSIIASGYAPEQQIAAHKAWQYILTGVGVAVVLCVVGLLSRSALVWPPVVWGMVESGQQAVCRLAKPIGGVAPSAAPFDGLCGVDFWWAGLIAAAVIAVWYLDKIRGK